jgi:uncharacterized LabA/DUF88 family protein
VWAGESAAWPQGALTVTVVMRRSYLYVDGESHYIRSREFWKSIHGDDAELDEVHFKGQGTPSHTAMMPGIHVNAKASFFYDGRFTAWNHEENSSHQIGRAVYFTSCVGGEPELHEVRTIIRECEFEPHVVQEKKQLSDQRANVRKQSSLIEKAKGVDIALACRMLEDSYADNFDSCYLLTSDVDFLPVIEAVRRRGKRVLVLGYRQGLAERSPFEYVPDKFFDLEKTLREWYERKKCPKDEIRDRPRGS